MRTGSRPRRPLAAPGPSAGPSQRTRGIDDEDLPRQSTLRPATPLRTALLGLVLAGLNLAVAVALLTLLNAWGEWSFFRFLGLFGCVQLAGGLALATLEHVWQVPAGAWAGSERPRLSPALLRPAWARATPAVVGAACVVASAASEGVAPGWPLVLPLVASWYTAIAGLSLLLARWGADHPSADVAQVVLRRPARPELVVPPLSVGSLSIQVLLNLAVFPLVAALPPGALFQPGFGPSAGLLLGSIAVAAALGSGGIAFWRRL